MADIISIDGRRKAGKPAEADRLQQRKLFAVRHTVQCARCRLKCEKCGIQLDSGSHAVAGGHHSLRVPYRFCEFCARDYIDYIERLKGRGDSECYWQNEAWQDAWGHWIRYQGALDSFAKTPEFVRLLTEVQDALSDG